jgi:alkanesulfonate monooxygenase SsuD/methylene tetrahydromethanopterin reductase-like flavin-dependent oxidoreductase (luciferase family)
MISRGTNTYGLLLPHFGPTTSRDLLLRVGKLAEDVGFDALWVRDHLVYHPHAYEDQDLTHIEPFVVMSALAGVTQKISLGTATMIPYRHPIHTALLLGSLEFMAGKGRVIAAWGLGNDDKEFQAIGTGDWDRKKLVEENVRIIRAIWAATNGKKASYDGEFFKFEGVAIQPVPDTGNIQHWYGGGSKAAVRRAVEYCDGYLPSRMPRRDLAERMQRMDRLCRERGRTERPIVASICYVSPAKSVEEGVASIDLAQLLSATARQFTPPASGKWETLEDLDGVAIAGPPDVVVEQVRAYQRLGVEHFVFDFRSRFADFEDCVETVGRDILPLLRAG